MKKVVSAPCSHVGALRRIKKSIQHRMKREETNFAFSFFTKGNCVTFRDLRNNANGDLKRIRNLYQKRALKETYQFPEVL
jgi:hypothetical protein